MGETRSGGGGLTQACAYCCVRVWRVGTFSRANIFVGVPNRPSTVDRPRWLLKLFPLSRLLRTRGHSLEFGMTRTNGSFVHLDEP